MPAGAKESARRLTLGLLGLPLLVAHGGRTLADWISDSAIYPSDDEDETE